MSLTEAQRERYARQIILPEVGVKGQAKLLAGSVLLVGVGGLGSSAGLYLAAAGVGTIGVIDADVVDLTNLQRQVIHCTADLGKPKVESAAAKMQAINPDVQVKPYRERLTAANAPDILDAYDFVIDCTDNFPSKFLVADACHFADKPYSHAGILRFDGQLLTVKPGASACYRCVFHAPPPADAVPSCSQAGVLGVLPGVIGTLQATEAVKFLLEQGALLTDVLLVYNALDMSFRKVAVKRNPACPLCGEHPSIAHCEASRRRPLAGRGEEDAIKRGQAALAVDRKYNALKKAIRETRGLAVAFSGGVDSTFLAAVVRAELGDRALAVTALSPLYPEHEQQEARKLAERIGIRHETVISDELDLPGFADNPPNRCYLCKNELFTVVRKAAEALGIEAVADGTNADDRNDYRPGRQAGEEHGILSPLLEAGLCKTDIRELSRRMGLPTADKAAFACLASRFPYGTRITKEKLAAVGTLETHLRRLGFHQFRVRHHGEVARIEVEPEAIKRLCGRAMRLRLAAAGKEAGFLYITVDLEGYRTGSMNEALGEKQKGTTR